VNIWLLEGELQASRLKLESRRGNDSTEKDPIPTPTAKRITKFRSIFYIVLGCKNKLNKKKNTKHKRNR
jgi:hypothetical protein